ncbi:MAG: NAD(P)-dependent oxidoreductase [Actinomycetota bacterium]|nr:NAD(P)-dependent oxidoreductase [Actinomycetota bacterium]
MREALRTSRNPLAADLDFVLEHTRPLWEDLRGERLFVTGGTGFFGCWLLESFVWANQELALGASVTVLTRDPMAFSRKAPHLANHPSVRLHTGEVRSFEILEGSFSHVIHAATEASEPLNRQQPFEMFDTIIGGTRHTLEFARAAGARRLLLTSSGAVYGPQAPDLARVSEEYAGAPNVADPAAAYGEGKRAAEMQCVLSSRAFGLEAKIARCFAFVGPYLPLDTHFAIGNFIRDALTGGPIVVHGGGMPCRSYMYAADLAVWLWTILFAGASMRPYNVGSEVAVDLADLAALVARIAGLKSGVEVRGEADRAGAGMRYVPSTRRAQAELGLREWTSLEAGIGKTVSACRGVTGQRPARRRVGA